MDGLEALAQLEERFNPNHDPHSGEFSTGGHGGGVATMVAEPITAAQARGNSRAVSSDEFQHLAAEGKAQLEQMRHDASPTVGLDRHWAQIKQDTYAATRDSWGGATIDAHTGQPLASNADRYAISVKSPGQRMISVPEAASFAQYSRVMDQAKREFSSQLVQRDHHLGVFHDDDNHRIDIDPVVVVSTPHEVETIGAYTHAVGGAYHFTSGNGYFPPHVSGTRSQPDGLPVHFGNAARWHAAAVKAQKIPTKLLHGGAAGRMIDAGDLVELERRRYDPSEPGLRFNPNHDPHSGEFSTGGGAGGGLAGYAAMEMGARREKFGQLSAAQQDALAAPETSIDAAISATVGQLGPHATGSPTAAARDRLKKAVDAGLIMPDSAKILQEHAKLIDADLNALGVSIGERRDITLHALDAMIAQEHEAYGRTLGDHGVHHLMGDAEMANAILQASPRGSTPAARLAVNLTAAYHDAGYLTPTSRIFLDDGHPRWGQTYFNKSVAPALAHALSPAFSSRISHIIATHAEVVGHLDWNKHPVSSAFRTADNLALFHREKLPPMFRYVSSNVGTLTRLAAGKLTVAKAQAQMRAQIRSSGLPKPIQARMLKGVGEVGPKLPKYTLGMVGASVHSIQWVKDHPSVHLRRTRAQVAMQRYLDLGQAQFKKLMEEFGHNPAELSKVSHLLLRDARGVAQIELFLSGPQLSALLQELVERRYDPELEERFNPNHDPHSGQFTSGHGGGATATTSPASSGAGATANPSASAVHLGTQLQLFTDKYRNATIEHALGLDVSGKQILAKGGETDHVEFTVPELQKMRGGVLIHNHPPQLDRQAHDGGSFSPEDIRFAFSERLHGIHAVGPEATFSMLPPKGHTFDRTVWDDHVDFLERSFANIEFWQADGLTWDQNLGRVSDIWKGWAERTGYSYKITPA